MKAALLKSISAHPALNTVLTEETDGSVCLKTDDSPFEIPVFTLSDVAFDKMKKTLVRPFDLSGDKLARIEIYQTPTGIWLFEDMHHLICDGSSLAILAEDVRRALDGQELVEEKISVFDLADQEDEWLPSSDAKAALDYWNTLLADCETDCEPERDRWEETQHQAWLIRDFSLDENRFSALLHRVGCSTSAFFTAAFAYLTSVFTGQEDVLFNTIYSGRDEENANTVGMFIRTIPFRMNLKEQNGIDAFLSQVNTELRDSRWHSRYPYLRLADAFGLRPQLEFSYQRDLSENPLVSGTAVEVERLYDEAHVEAASVLFEVRRLTSGAYQVHMGYRSDRFSSAWAESFAGSYLRIVQELFEKSSLLEMSLVAEDDLRLLDSFNNTETPRDNTDIVTQFRRCAARRPDAVAIVAEGRCYTYGEADRITDALAGYLRSRGVGRGSVVSILIPRNEYMPLASLGVLKSGAAYQPLDPSYPEARLRFMIEDARAKILIADRSLIEKLENWQGPILLTEEIPGLPDEKPFDAEFRPEDLFVLLYTSGTTGTPKGVMIQHGNVTELAAWAQGFYRMDETTRYAAYASFGFDAHMVELYPTLCCGGALYIISDEIRLDLGAIAEFINQNGITLSQMTTQVGRQFALAYEGGSLKDLMVGGEALVPIDPKKIHFTLHNAYGPSECTVLATVQPVDQLYFRIPVGMSSSMSRTNSSGGSRCLRRGNC